MPRVAHVAVPAIGLGEADRPAGPIVVESSRCQADEELPLGIVEDPTDIEVDRHHGDERGRLDFPGSGRDHGSGCGEVSLAEVGHGLRLDRVEVGGRESQSAIEDSSRFRVAPHPEEHFTEVLWGPDRAGIEALRLPEMLERSFPASETPLGACRRRNEIGIVRRQAPPFRIQLSARRRSFATGSLVVTECQETFWTAGCQRERLLRRLPGALVELSAGSAAPVQSGAGSRDPRPCRANPGSSATACS